MTKESFATFQEQIKESGYALLWNNDLKQWELREPWNIRQHSDIVIADKRWEDICDEYSKRRIKSKLEKAVDKLLSFKPSYTPHDFNKHETKEQVEFFSEAFLYNAIGKEDARTVLALLRQVLEAAGIHQDRL